MSDTKPLPTLDTREIGVECSCGFKRRATKTAARGEHWNGREIEALHWFQISEEVKAHAAIGDPVQAVPVHRVSMGLLATMDWPALTPEEQRLGEAWMDGNAEGTRSAREHMRKRLAAVTATEFGE